MTDTQSERSAVRAPDAIHHHYVVEKELATRLRTASRQERPSVYADVYDELYRRVPDHPQLTQKASAADSAAAVERQMRFLRRFLEPGTTLLEIGSGDCGLSMAAAQICGFVHAVDVSVEITKGLKFPENVRPALSDGITIPVPPNSVSVAYSNQLMEHLHPDDAIEQLQNIFRALEPGGSYICITPSPLNGPHDVSQHFDLVAKGFHLKEYSVTELDVLFRTVGFTRLRVYVGAKGIYVSVPVVALKVVESALGLLPVRLRRRVAMTRAMNALLGKPLVGTKPE
jgi:SAM-dependent methyltransferase